MTMMLSTGTSSKSEFKFTFQSGCAQERAGKQRTSYNGLASVRFALRKSSGDVLKSGEYDVSLKCPQPYARRHMIEPPPARAFSNGRRARVDFGATRRGVDFHKVISEREKQSGEQLERTQMGLGSSSDR